MQINIGSGQFKKDGVNVDNDPATNPDILHDLNQFPYPFEDKEFDTLEADHVLEHLDDPFKVMKEFYRIANKLTIRVPHFSRGFTHSGHKWGFDVTFPYYFKKTFNGGFQGLELKTESIKLTWFAQPYFKKQVLPKPIYYLCFVVGKIIDFFANLSPIICSRVWCYWVGGFEEIEFIFT